MAKPNYSFEKRQRELAKKKKKEEKEKGKADRKAVGGSEGAVADTDERSESVAAAPAAAGESSR